MTTADEENEVQQTVVGSLIEIQNSYLCCFIGMTVNPLSPKIHIQILQTDLHQFSLRIVERIWFKIKAFSLW